MITVGQTFLGSPDLVREWTSRILRARYEQSLLGWLWAAIQPISQAVILAVVFTWVVPVETGGVPYLLFSYVAMVPWTFFVGSLTEMTDSLVNNMNLVNKIYFPREVLPIACMLARLVDFAIAAAFVLVLMIYFRVPATPGGLMALPLIVLVQILLTMGLGLAAAALNVFARDVRGILILGTQLWFYASPVLYPLDKVPAAVRPFYTLNPMVGIIEGYRAILLRGAMPDASLAVSAVVSAVVLVAGSWAFKKAEFQFADIV
jgi:lipopolysaccharide transport system permease protein